MYQRMGCGLLGALVCALLAPAVWAQTPNGLGRAATIDLGNAANAKFGTAPRFGSFSGNTGIRNQIVDVRRNSVIPVGNVPRPTAPGIPGGEPTLLERMSDKFIANLPLFVKAGATIAAPEIAIPAQAIPKVTVK